MPYRDGDLLSWQASAREKLSLLLGLDRFHKVPDDIQIDPAEKTGKMTRIRFTFQSEAGYRVPCYLLLPPGIEKPPVMICLQGHTTGMHISLGIEKYPKDAGTIFVNDRDFCLQAVKHGFAAIALEQRNFGEQGGSEKGPQCLESTMTALLMGRTTIGERVWDMMRLIDVLERHFPHLLDIDAVCCMGHSGGGTATAYTAALESRLKLAMPSGAMCTYRDSIAAMKHCSCNYVPHIAEYFDMGDLMAMACPKLYVQVNGSEDPIFPLPGAKEVFEQGRRAYFAQGCADRCCHIVGAGGHRFFPEPSWSVVRKLLGLDGGRV
jgi:dienelactone hydrolase